MMDPAPRRRFWGPVSLIDMNMARCCHWIVGNEHQGPHTLMCAAPKLRADSYCEEHELRAHAAPHPRWTSERKEKFRRKRRKQFISGLRIGLR